MGPDGSLPCSQQPNSCPCPVPDQSSLGPPNRYLRSTLDAFTQLSKIPKPRHACPSVRFHWTNLYEICYLIFFLFFSFFFFPLSLRLDHKLYV